MAYLKLSIILVACLTQVFSAPLESSSLQVSEIIKSKLISNILSIIFPLVREVPGQEGLTFRNQRQRGFTRRNAVLCPLIKS